MLNPKEECIAGVKQVIQPSFQQPSGDPDEPDGASLRDRDPSAGADPVARLLCMELHRNWCKYIRIICWRNFPRCLSTIGDRWPANGNIISNLYSVTFLGTEWHLTGLLSIPFYQQAIKSHDRSCVGLVGDSLECRRSCLA
jgi:hypothetical protein